MSEQQVWKPVANDFEYTSAGGDMLYISAPRPQANILLIDCKHSGETITNSIALPRDKRLCELVETDAPAQGDEGEWTPVDFPHEIVCAAFGNDKIFIGPNGIWQIYIRENGEWRRVSIFALPDDYELRRRTPRAQDAQEVDADGS